MDKQKARNSISEALRSIDEFSSSPSFSQSDPVLRNQLSLAQETLLNMLNTLENQEVQPFDTTPFLGRMITDSWPFDLELGEKIITAENEYFREIKST